MTYLHASISLRRAAGRRRPCVVALFCALVLLATPAGPRLSAQAAAPPKLVVILVVDQMRVDYLQW